MELSQFKNQDRKLVTQLLLILEAPNYLFLQMYLRKLEPNGSKHFQSSIAKLIKHSATSRSHVKK